LDCYVLGEWRRWQAGSAWRATGLMGRINIFDWTSIPDLSYSYSEFVKPSALKAFLLSQSDNVKLTASGLIA
jgi:hypothetical protein